MAARGRKSAASLSIVAGSIDTRPEPPAFLTRFQRELWRRTVAAEATSFFKTAALQQLLTEYCRHTSAAHGLAQAIDKLEASGAAYEDETLGKYIELLKARDRETKALADKATKLRLSNQSRYVPHAAARAAAGAGPTRKPWEAAG